MEQQGHQFWMWTKRKKQSLSSCNNLITSSTKPSSSYDDSSWEEQAFAEDASGPLGGCIWPPRSYTCSFCRREFRSAQALGGHMNVHRRDRARLKQPSSPQNTNNELHQIPNTSSSFMGFLYPNCSITNPNSSPSSIPPPQGHMVASSYYSPLYSSFKSNGSNLAEAEEKITEVLDCDRFDEENDGKSDLAFSLNLVVCRGIETKEDDMISCNKKRRTCETSTILPLFPNSYSSEDEFSPSSSNDEELDLELRLGQSKHKV